MTFHSQLLLNITTFTALSAFGCQTDEDAVKPQLAIMIDGKSYRGEIHHDHDHGDHDGDK